ncbi:MAG: DNA repair protein RadA, partial [Actinobacteria bacterium]
MSELGGTFRGVTRDRIAFVCSACGQRLSQWTGRCPVLGGGLVPGSVVMLAGPPGIGKSTLVLHLLGALVARGTACLLVSGEESRAQVSSRARRLRIPVGDVGFAPGRDLDVVLDAARATRPAVLAVDSIQTL